MSDSNAEYAVPNYIVRAHRTPTDEFFDQQWALHNTGQADGFPGADIQAVDAWDLETGRQRIVLAVLDSGVDYGHPDFVLGNIWTNEDETDCNDGIDDDGNGYIDDCVGWDFTTCEKIAFDGTCDIIVSEDNDPMDEQGHGTHVAGIAGANGFNGQGIAGVMWLVQIMPVRFLNADGKGNFFDAVNAVDYAVMNGADIINASFGGSKFVPELFDAIEDARDAGVLFVASAGNDGTNNDTLPTYPASFNLDNIIAVASTNQRDERSSFSNFGVNSVHVGAPGEYILSTVPPSLAFGACIGSPFVGYDFCDGTSMASPHVAGLAGLIMSFYPHFDYTQVRGTILRFVDPLSELNGWVQSGGKINAYKAISSLVPPTGLFANATTYTQTSLTWSDMAMGEDGYKVEQSTSGGPFIQIGTTGQGVTTFPVSGLDSSNTYSYQVRAFNTIPADSAYSNVAVVPAAPTGLTATPISKTQIDLAWTDNANNEQGFSIWRKGPGEDVFSEIALVDENITTFSNTGLNRARNFTYVVKAYTDTGNSAYTNQAKAKTLGSRSGGNNCSIGARMNIPTSLATITVMLLPLALITFLRHRRKNRGR
jgi:subtilisin family serine protease